MQNDRIRRKKPCFSLSAIRPRSELKAFTDLKMKLDRFGRAK